MANHKRIPSPAVTFPSLLIRYSKTRNTIENRLKEFKRTFKHGDGEIFKELCFCIFAANTSARMGMHTVDVLDDALLTDDARAMQIKLHAPECRYRFWRVRAQYIAHTRNYLQSACDFKIKKYILSFPSVYDARNHFAEEKNIRGIGFKEASHFFRNIGFVDEFAILDKHVLQSLREVKAIGNSQHATGRKNYLFVEKKMKALSGKIGIPMGALDLLLWSGKTGEILK